MAPVTGYGEVLEPWDPAFLEIVGTLDKESREFHLSTLPLYVGEYKWESINGKV
jgi:hypothetical protein